MRVLVPFDARDPKTRLSPILSTDQRSELASRMLGDVLATLADFGADPTVLATEPVDVDVPVAVDDRPLTPAINDRLASTDGPIAVVMADLAIATPAALERLFEVNAGVVLAPGLGGGTNAVVVDHPDFRVDFHGTSYLDHVAAAADCGAEVATVDSFRLAVDVDERADLIEVLLHGEGATADYLRSIGVEIDRRDGRVGVRLPDESASDGASDGDERADGPES